MRAVRCYEQTASDDYLEKKQCDWQELKIDVQLAKELKDDKELAALLNELQDWVFDEANEAFVYAMTIAKNNCYDLLYQTTDEAMKMTWESIRGKKVFSNNPTAS